MASRETASSSSAAADGVAQLQDVFVALLLRAAGKHVHSGDGDDHSGDRHQHSSDADREKRTEDSSSGHQHQDDAMRTRCRDELDAMWLADKKWVIEAMAEVALAAPNTVVGVHALDAIVAELADVETDPSCITSEGIVKQIDTAFHAMTPTVMSDDVSEHLRNAAAELPQPSNSGCGLSEVDFAFRKLRALCSVVGGIADGQQNLLVLATDPRVLPRVREVALVAVSRQLRGRRLPLTSRLCMAQEFLRIVNETHSGSSSQDLVRHASPPPSPNAKVVDDAEMDVLNLIAFDFSIHAHEAVTYTYFRRLRQHAPQRLHHTMPHRLKHGGDSLLQRREAAKTRQRGDTGAAGGRGDRFSSMFVAGHATVDMSTVGYFRQLIMDTKDDWCRAVRLGAYEFSSLHEKDIPVSKRLAIAYVNSTVITRALFFEEDADTWFVDRKPFTCAKVPVRKMFDPTYEGGTNDPPSTIAAMAIFDRLQGAALVLPDKKELRAVVESIVFRDYAAAIDYAFTGHRPWSELFDRAVYRVLPVLMRITSGPQKSHTSFGPRITMGTHLTEYLNTASDRPWQQRAALLAACHSYRQAFMDPSAPAKDSATQQQDSDEVEQVWLAAAWSMCIAEIERAVGPLKTGKGRGRGRAATPRRRKQSRAEGGAGAAAANPAAAADAGDDDEERPSSTDPSAATTQSSPEERVCLPLALVLAEQIVQTMEGVDLLVSAVILAAEKTAVPELDLANVINTMLARHSRSNARGAFSALLRKHASSLTRVLVGLLASPRPAVSTDASIALSELWYVLPRAPIAYVVKALEAARNRWVGAIPMWSGSAKHDRGAFDSMAGGPLADGSTIDPALLRRERKLVLSGEAAGVALLSMVSVTTMNADVSPPPQALVGAALGTVVAALGSREASRGRDGLVSLHDAASLLFRSVPESALAEPRLIKRWLPLMVEALDATDDAHVGHATRYAAWKGLQCLCFALRVAEKNEKKRAKVSVMNKGDDVATVAENSGAAIALRALCLVSSDAARAIAHGIEFGGLPIQDTNAAARAASHFVGAISRHIPAAVRATLVLQILSACCKLRPVEPLRPSLAYASLAHELTRRLSAPDTFSEVADTKICELLQVTFVKMLAAPLWTVQSLFEPLYRLCFVNLCERWPRSQPEQIAIMLSQSGGRELGPTAEDDYPCFITAILRQWTVTCDIAANRGTRIDRAPDAFNFAMAHTLLKPGAPIPRQAAGFELATRTLEDPRVVATDDDNTASALQCAVIASERIFDDDAMGVPERYRGRGCRGPRRHSERPALRYHLDGGLGLDAAAVDEETMYTVDLPILRSATLRMMAQVLASPGQPPIIPPRDALAQSLVARLAEHADDLKSALEGLEGSDPEMLKRRLREVVTSATWFEGLPKKKADAVRRALRQATQPAPKQQAGSGTSRAAATTGGTSSSTPKK